jgi:hypothetical protein
MVRSIFDDDILIFIKGGNAVDIYLITKKVFQDVLITAIKRGPRSAVSVLNRYESNSLRTERDIFLSSKVSNHLGLNFDETKESIFNSIENSYQNFKDKLIDSVHNSNIEIESIFQEFMLSVKDYREKFVSTSTYDVDLTPFHKNILIKEERGELKIRNKY